MGVGDPPDRSCHVGYGGATPRNEATEAPAESRQRVGNSPLLPPPVRLLKASYPEGWHHTLKTSLEAI